MKRLPFLFLLVLAAFGCSSAPPAGGFLRVPDVVFHSVRFFFEQSADGANAFVQLDPLAGVVLLDGKPMIRRPRPSLFEVDGRQYHFKKNSQVYIFAPRPNGECTLTFKTLPLTLVGPKQDRFVVEQREAGPRVTLKYELTTIDYENGRYFLAEGKELSAVSLKRGLRITRWGEVEPR